jgi:hypothetical protein
LDERGNVVLRRRMQPRTIVNFAAKLPSCTIAMEACCGAHYLGRLCAAVQNYITEAAASCRPRAE